MFTVFTTKSTLSLTTGQWLYPYLGDSHFSICDDVCKYERFGDMTGWRRNHFAFMLLLGVAF